MKAKPYASQEPTEPQQLREPAVSYGLPQDIDSLKQEAIRELMNIFDAERLSEALNYIRLLGKEARQFNSPPCQYTSETLRERISQAMEQSKQGQGISHDEMRKRKPIWK